MSNWTRSVAARFGTRYAPARASNDTCTALGQHGSDWSRDFATLTFDLGGHGVYGWCGSSPSIRTPSLKFVGIAIRKIWRTMCVTINGGETSKFGHARPLGSPITRYVYATDGQTDRRTDGQKQRLLPLSLQAGHNNHQSSHQTSNTSLYNFVNINGRKQQHLKQVSWFTMYELSKEQEVEWS